MNNCCGMVCCICGAKVDNVEHIALDKNGYIVSMCDRCYNLSYSFFKPEGSKYDKSSDSD